MFEGKTVLVTGGTGTFGRALVRRMLKEGIAKLIVFSRDELKQFEMRSLPEFQDSRLRFFLGDIRDRDRLERAFEGVDVVVHAAALKQVSALEYNPMEAVKTNIMGTQNVIDAALDTGVHKVLTISSDKAVYPVNLYGATKLCAEKLTVAANSYRQSGAPGPYLSVMRYGNILGSRGSFLEVIEKQRSTGKITLTDARMTRFWLRIEDIMNLVTETLTRMQGGEIFVPKMESLSIVDVITCVAPECKIKVIGIRPGEKLHEVLITEHEARRTYDVGKMYAIHPEGESLKGMMLNGEPVEGDFVYASNHERFLRSIEHAPRILSLLEKNGKKRVSKKIRLNTSAKRRSTTRRTRSRT